MTDEYTEGGGPTGLEDCLKVEGGGRLCTSSRVQEEEGDRDDGTEMGRGRRLDARLCQNQNKGSHYRPKGALF